MYGRACLENSANDDRFRSSQFGSWNASSRKRLPNPEEVKLKAPLCWLFVLSVKTWPNLSVRNLLALGQAQVTASPVETSSIQARGRWIA